MEQVDWADFGFPSWEVGKDGFPRPGKVVQRYRMLKKQTDATWTQRRLARELGVTEKSVRSTENGDMGLDSLALRRKLAAQLNIPLILLGLASLEEEAGAGQTLKQYRKMKEKKDPLRTQLGVAMALGMTEKAVRDMENHNIGLDSITRRRVLAQLLTIPPAALGIVTLEEVLGQQQRAGTKVHVSTSTGKKATLDIAFYKDRLKTIWNCQRTSTAQDLLVQITADIASLNAVLPYASGSDETEIRDMLCRYHQLYADIMCDLGWYDKALEELEKAAILAERIGNPHLLAATLLWRGEVLCDRGDVIVAQAKIDAARGNRTGSNQKLTLAHSDYKAAIGCYTRARNLERIPPELHGVLLLVDGRAQAHVAHGNRDALLAALALVKQSKKMIAEGKDKIEDEFSMRMSERRYHITKAAALLAAGWSREALQELTDLMDLPPEGDMTRMNAYTTYLWSQAYADLGNIDAAATPAQDTLEVMKQVKSNINITRIAGLQAQLSLVDSKNIEVIRLGVMVNS